MDTDSDDTRPATTPRWLVDRVVVVPVQFVLLGLALVLLTEPVRTVAGHFLPEAVPYLWLGMVAFTLLAVGESVGNRADDVTVALDLTEQMQELSRREITLVLVSLLGILATALSAHLGTVAGLSLLLSGVVPIEGVAVAAPFLLSPLDSWFGRTYGYSAGLLGVRVSVWLLTLLVRVQGVSSEIPTQAGNYGRALLGGGQTTPQPG